MKEIALTNRSKLSAVDFAFYARAVEIQLKRDVYPAWKNYLPLGEMPLAPYGDIADLAPNSCHTVTVVDTIDDPTLGGYHSGIQAAGWAFGRARPLSTIISHEAIELATDPYLNFWNYSATRDKWYAREIGDPVERDSYTITVNLFGAERFVEVSNFVYPAWFEMFNMGVFDAFDHMGLCKEPFQVRGYAVTKDERNTISNVYGASAPRAAIVAKASDPHSRTARRYSPAA